ncbi:MAG TPA: hypothetical protein H9926_14525, partial [Candidatus Eisenbergiella intestinigallinarum]|nr:hypothetical protein [Candidatus Eisenbergiella intestinigallinarum]
AFHTVDMYILPDQLHKNTLHALLCTVYSQGGILEPIIAGKPRQAAVWMGVQARTDTQTSAGR